MQENEKQTSNVTNNTNSAPVQPTPTNKEKAQEAGKDIAEVAAKGAATYFGGPIGGAVAGKVLNSKVGQKVTGAAGKAIARNPLSRGALSKAQPAISASKPLANSAIGALGAKGGSGGMSASLGSSATPASSPTGTSNLGIPKSPLSGGGDQSSSRDDNQSSSPLGGRLNPLKSNDNSSSKENGIASVIQTWWKKLPISAKLGIIYASGTFLVVVIIAAIFMGLSNVFLDYSDSVAESENYKEEYEEYFQDLCDDDDDCTEEEKEKAKKLLESQESFYKRLDSLSEKYFASDERSKQKQRYIVLTTVFYGYSPEDMLKGGAFNLDEDGDDEIDENTNSDSNVYKEEYDTLKELAKQFDVYTPFCIYTITNSDGTTEEKQEEIKDSDGNTFKLGYWDAVKVGWPVWNNPIEGFEEARTSCNEKSGRVSTQKSAGQAAEDNFYKYLLESTFLDKRSSLRESFVNYAQSHGLDKDNIDTDHWPEEDLQEVRKQVIKDIKNIVEAQMPKENELAVGNLSTGNNTAYWWPIGSAEITEVNGIKFASGDPGQILDSMGSPISQKFGSTEMGSPHGGTDIYANETTNIIASIGGTVIDVVNNITGGGNNSTYCEGVTSWGNYVLIEDASGKRQRYAHLSYGTIEVKTGDKVQQGQLLAKAGSSGCVTGPHLHFEMYVNGERVDSEQYVSYNDPRPVGLRELIALVDCLEGGTADAEGYYPVLNIGDGVHTVGHGVTLEYNIERFKKYGINAYDYMSTSARLPQDIVDNIRTDIVLEKYDNIQRVAADNGFVLEYEKISALVSFVYNWGNIRDFVEKYDSYGDTEEFKYNFFLSARNIGSSPGSPFYGGHTTRRNDEWMLFHNHEWRCYGNALNLNT